MAATICGLSTVGSLSTGGFYTYYRYTSVNISRSASPIFLFEVGYSSNTLLSTGRVLYLLRFLGGEEGMSGSNLTADVGAGSGSPGSSARAWPPLVFDKPCKS
jgi:hypothetical protein